MAELAMEIAELQSVHRGLEKTGGSSGEVVLEGVLAFEVEPEGLASITDSFEISIRIPDVYPDDLPRVTETGGKIEKNYEHVFTSGTLCLGVPIEMQRIFSQQPTLLGFVNKLVVPYLYGYCYWKMNGEHPFGERRHGGEGIIQYYIEELHLNDEFTALAFIRFLCEQGYRGHERCPCGSGRKVLKCHGLTLRALHRNYTPKMLRQDLLLAQEYLVEKFECSQLLLRQEISMHIRQMFRRR